MELSAFDVRHAGEVASWATTAAEALAWCSHEGHPVPAEVVGRWTTEPGCSAFVAVHDSKLVGYGELWVDEPCEEVELARLIVAPAERGRGFGLALTKALLVRARATSANIFLRVRPENRRAQSVYLRAGFRPVPEAQQEEWNAGQPVQYLWMQAIRTSPPTTSRR